MTEFNDTPSQPNLQQDTKTFLISIDDSFNKNLFINPAAIGDGYPSPSEVRIAVVTALIRALVPKERIAAILADASYPLWADNEKRSPKEINSEIERIYSATIPTWVSYALQCMNVNSPRDQSKLKRYSYDEYVSHADKTGDHVTFIETVDGIRWVRCEDDWKESLDALEKDSEAYKDQDNG